MSFNVYFSDPTKAATPIIVEDGSPGNPGNVVDTSLTLLGKNASGYAKSIATNFVQLLENFSSPDAPNNPIEGQIWYDNENKRLKINDSTAGGANWKPISGVYQQSSEPSTALPGDIWVDTSRGQLFITLDGIGWSLVGPVFSSTLKTGFYPETILDKFGEPHTIIKNYINNSIIEIVSPESFTPQQVISGFESGLEAGLNLNANLSSKLNATAASAESLLVTTPYSEAVSGNNFVRNDVSNVINAALTIQDSLQIGANPTFILQKSNTYTNDLLNTYPGGQISFKITDSDNILTEIVKIMGREKRVGINLGTNNNPDTALHVKGDVKIEGQLIVSTSAAGNGLNISGPTALASSLSVVGTSTFSTSTVKSLLTVGKIGDSTNTIIITPAVNNIYNIGSSTSKFANIYSTNLWGTLQGSVIGSATYLANTSTWSLGGQFSGGLKLNDVLTPFRGDPGTYIFDGKLTSNAFTDQLSTASVALSDQIIVGTAGRNNGISKISKANFLGELYSNLVPTGTILPWAGVSITGFDPITGNPNNTPSIPNNLKDDGTYNWLLCDGSIIDFADYPELYNIIKWTYGKPGPPTQCRLPDLRGRMIVGYDNMSNGFGSDRSPTSPAGRVPEAEQPADVYQQRLGTAGLQGITGGNNTATIVTGSLGGSITGVWNNTTTSISSVMNPFFAINYIIKT